MSRRWLELARDKNAYLYPTALYWWCAQHACRMMGIRGNIIAVWYKNHSFSYLTTENGLAGAGKIILRKLGQSDALLKKIEAVNRREIPIMLQAAKKLSGKQLRALTGQELLARWSDWLEKFVSMMTYSVLGTVMEMEEPLLSKTVESIISKKLRSDQSRLGGYFQILTTPTDPTVAVKEERELLNLRMKHTRNTLGADDIRRHLNAYAWIGYGYNGPPWTVTDIRRRLRSLPSSPDKIRRLLEEKRTAGPKLARQQRRLERLLGLSPKERRLTRALRTLGFWKAERKFLNQQAHLLMEDFISDIIRRHGLTKTQAAMLAPNEIPRVLLDGRVDARLLEERIRESVVLFHGTSYRVLSGTAASRVVREIEESLKVDSAITTLTGSTAYAGSARGIVRRIDEATEMNKLKAGDILVSTSTNPQIIPAMKKAGAIVTDSGGITSHAAIIARELKVPCVIGTKIATRVLKDGDKVEVDATKGTVRKV